MTDDLFVYQNDTPVLSWQLRHSILIDAASGLQYLHTVETKPVIHGDIKRSVCVQITFIFKLSNNLLR